MTLPATLIQEAIAWDSARDRSLRTRRLDPGLVSVYVIHTMQSREIIDRLTADGWRKVAQKGSHVQFKHPTKPGRVTGHPKRDIPIGTLRSIEKQYGRKLMR